MNSNKNFTKLKTNFRKKMKEKKCDVTIAKDFSKIMIRYVDKKGWNNVTRTMKFHLSLRNGVLTLLDDFSYYFNQEIFMDVKNFLEDVVDSLEMDAFIISNNRYTAEKLENDKDYQEIGELVPIKDWLSVQAAKEKDFIKVLKKENLMKTIELMKAYKKTIHQMKIKDITMKVDYEEETDSEMVKFYYQGFSSNFITKIHGGRITFHTVELGELIATEPEEVKEKLELFFQKIHQKQKVRNIFDYPRTYFNEQVKKKLTRNKNAMDSIYEHLKNHYTPQEIEEKAAKMDKIKLHVKYETRSWHTIVLTELFDYLFVLNPLNEVFKFELNQIEKAMEKYTEEVKKQSEKEAKETLNNFKSEIEKLKERQKI